MGTIDGKNGAIQCNGVTGRFGQNAKEKVYRGRVCIKFKESFVIFRARGFVIGFAIRISFLIRPFLILAS
jgi:hypothetical protein